jgi:hypothetical protein
MYADGAGLYLKVTGDGDERVAKSWIFRFTLRGTAQRDGPELACDVWPGGCPRESHRVAPPRQERARRGGARGAKSLTFKECAEQYLAAHRAGWRNAKHTAQWSTTVNTVC